MPIQTPAFFTYFTGTCRLDQVADGSLLCRRLNLTTGDFEIAPAGTVDQVLALFDPAIRQVGEAEFIDLTERARARYLRGEGPIFELYETAEDLTNQDSDDPAAAARDNTLAASIRRQTFALWTQEFARRASGIAPTFGFRSILEPPAETPAARQALAALSPAAAQAVAQVQEWLADTYPEQTGKLRVDYAEVRRTPEGWRVPYNTVDFLDRGQRVRAIFPAPALVYREIEHDLRQAASQPGGLSTPIRYPDREYWREIVDDEYRASGFGYLGVPPQAITGWERVTADGTETGEIRQNPEYHSGPVRSGFPKPENTLEYLQLFHAFGWLDRRKFVIGFAHSEVYFLVDRTRNLLATNRSYFEANTMVVATSPVRFTDDHLDNYAWRRVDIASLYRELANKPPTLELCGPDVTTSVEASEVLAALAEFPRPTPPVDEQGSFPELDPSVLKLAADTANRLGLPHPVSAPTREAQDARQRGYLLSLDECRSVVVGRSWEQRARSFGPDCWPADQAVDALAAEGLVLGQDGPRVNHFGKFFPVRPTTFSIGWHNVVGTCLGFALAAGLVTDFRDPRPPAVKWLVDCANVVIRSGRELDRRLVADLRPPQELTPGVAGLIAAIPTVLTAGHRQGPLPHVLEPAIRAIAAATGGSELDVNAALYFGLLLEQMLRSNSHSSPGNERYVTSLPAWAVSGQVLKGRQGSGWDEIRAMAQQSLAKLGKAATAAAPVVDAIGDGHSTLSVLGRALATVSGFENDPDEAVARIVLYGLYGEDNPAIAALAGAILGARTGVPGLPQQALRKLVSRFELEDLASDLVLRFAHHDDPNWPDETRREAWLKRYPPAPVEEPAEAEQVAAQPEAPAEPPVPDQPEAPAQSETQSEPEAQQAATSPAPVAEPAQPAEPATPSWSWDRLYGSLLAGAIGDALGAPIEFQPLERIIDEHGPRGITGYVRDGDGTGRITDDTQLTLFTAEALIWAHRAIRAAGGDPKAANPRYALQMGYQRWLHTQGRAWETVRGPRSTAPLPDYGLLTQHELFQRRSPGATCFASLENFGRTGVMADFEHPINDSKGCGGVIRVAPIAMWSTDPAEVFGLAAASAALTHGHPSGYLSAGALAVIVQRLLLDQPIRTAIADARAELLTWPGHEETVESLDMAVDLAAQGRPTARMTESLGTGFTGECALAIAVYATLVTRGPNNALVIAVNHSGDSDSTAAICGNIVGALYGVDAIRREWREGLRTADLVRSVAEDLFREFGPDPLPVSESGSVSGSLSAEPGPGTIPVPNPADVLPPDAAEPPTGRPA
ncbi:MAG TPA: ADP-ribosylglycohydrolase family protein [Pseudonocardiaceae bacterium]